MTTLTTVGAAEETGNAHPLKVAYVLQSIDLQMQKSRAVQLHSKHIITSLREIGHESSLLTLHGRNTLFGDNLDAIGRAATEARGRTALSDRAPMLLFESGIRRMQSTFNLPYFALFDSFRMYDACRQNLQGFDVIHERFSFLAAGAAYASKRLGIPYILEVNADLLAERQYKGDRDQRLRYWYAEQLTQYSFDAADTIISVSSQLRNHLIETWSLDPDKVVVLPNAADIDRFGIEPNAEPVAGLRRRLGLEAEPVLLFVGGFYPWHDLSLLLRGMSVVQNSVPAAKLLLVGDGETRADMERYAHDLGLADSVIFVGNVPHDDVANYVALADVAVAPSVPFFPGYGGSPLKLFEYMAGAKAIVATDTGQVTEILEHGQTGLLVEPHDAGGFGAAVAELLLDPQQRERLGANARAQAVARHSWVEYARQLEAIYRKAISYHG